MANQRIEGLRRHLMLRFRHQLRQRRMMAGQQQDGQQGRWNKVIQMHGGIQLKEWHEYTIYRVSGFKARLAAFCANHATSGSYKCHFC